MEINVKNFTFRIKDNIKIGKKTFSVNSINENDIKSITKRADKTYIIFAILMFLGFIPLFIADNNYEELKILWFSSIIYLFICLLILFIYTYRNADTIRNIKNIYFIHSLKDNEKDIEELLIEVPFANEFARCRINIKTKNISTKPYYILYNFKSRHVNILENKCIIDFDKKEILY